MAVTIETSDGTVELRGAATEATLASLVKAMDKKGLSSDKQTQKMGEQVNNLAKATKKVNVEFKGLGKSADDLADDLDKAAKSSQSWKTKSMNFFSTLGKGAESMVKFTAGVQKNGLSLDEVGNTVSSITPSLLGFGAAAGAAFGAMIGHVANLSQTFDALSSTGAAFTGNMFDLERVAAGSHLQLAEMVTVLKGNSEALAAFGGNTRNGARRFAELNQIVQTVGQRELRYLGIGAVEATEMVASFTAMQSRNTMFQTMSTNQQAFAAQGFIKEITLLANLTGQDRKQLAQEMANKKRRSDVELKLRTMGVEANNQYNMAMTLLTSKFGENSAEVDAFRTSVMGYGVAATTQGNIILNSPLKGAFDNVAKGFADGTFKVENFFKDLAGSDKAFADAFAGPIATAQFTDFGMSVAGTSVGLGDFQVQLKAIQELMVKEGITFTEAMASVNLTGASKSIKDAQIGLENVVKTTKLGANTVTEGSVTAINSTIKKVTGLFGPEGLETTIKTHKASLVTATTSATGFGTALDKLSKFITKMAAPVAEKVAPKGVSSVITGLAASAKETMQKVGSSVTGYVGTAAKALGIAGGAATGVMAYKNSDHTSEAGKIFEGVMTGGGQILGSMLGAALGSLGFGVGAIPGAIGGGFAGESIGAMIGSGGTKAGVLGDIASSLFSGAKSMFGFDQGGIVTQPVFNAQIAEKPGTTEGVFPLDNDFKASDLSQLKTIPKIQEALNNIAVAMAGMNNAELVDQMKLFNRNIKVVSNRLA